MWAAAEFPVTLGNASAAERRLVSLTTRVVNRTRGGELGGNVYFPLPPPRDDVVVEVIAVFDDGTTTTASGAIVAMA